MLPNDYFYWNKILLFHRISTFHAEKWKRCVFYGRSVSEKIIMLSDVLCTLFKQYGALVRYAKTITDERILNVCKIVVLF